MLAITALMFAAAPFVINTAPNEATMGVVYKIYFFHMPSAWMFLVAALVAGVASVRFLFFKRPTADGWALAAAAYDGGVAVIEAGARGPRLQRYAVR